MLSLHTVAIATLTLSTLTFATNFAPNDPTAHGLTIFYKLEPSEAKIKAFSTGDFFKPPSSFLECVPDVNAPFYHHSFGCQNPALSSKTTTPQDIYDYGNPVPECLSGGIVYEHLQWAVWTHACWARPSRAIDSKVGHAEAAFESSALAFRFLVLYQHGKHLLTLNTAMADQRTATDTEILSMKESLAARLAEVEATFNAETKRLEEMEGDHHDRFVEMDTERDLKQKQLNRDAEEAMSAREDRFWKDSWVHRNLTVGIDHCVGDYFERWMNGQIQGGWDWAGMGEPDPAFPVNFRVP